MRAFNLEYFPDHGACDFPCAIGVPQDFSVGIDDQLLADPCVEKVTGHDFDSVGQGGRNWKPDEFHKFFIRRSLHTSGRDSAKALDIGILLDPEGKSRRHDTIALQQNNTRGFIVKDFAGELFLAR